MYWPLTVALLVAVPEIVSFVAQLLQRSFIGRPVPAELTGIYDQEEYETSNRYTKAKSTFSLFKDIFNQVVFFTFWFVGGFPWLDDRCVGLHLQSEILTGVIYFGVFTLIFQVLDIPWDIYRTFGLEEKFGFNKTTPWTFVKDRLKALALTVLLGFPLLSAVLWFLMAAGPHGWLYVFLTITTFQVVLLFLMPVLILPLFMEMIQLPTGTAIITNESGKDAPKFLSSRVFYAREEQCQGKPCWATKDRRFTGSASGALLSLSWSPDAGGSSGKWVITEGEPGAGGTAYAATAPSSAAPDAAGLEGPAWVLSEAAEALAKEAAGSEGSTQDPLVKDGLKTSAVDVGSLRSKLLALADKLGYVGASIFVIDGSSRSAHSNAFCMGFGRFRRICLFDTLLPLMSEGEILAVLGHEIGHDRLYHVHTRLVFGIAYSFVMLYALGQFLTSQAVSSAFFVPEPKVYLGVVLFSIVWSVVDFVVSIPLTVQSRMNEFAADRYSIEADRSYGELLGSALKKLMKKSKVNLTPHPFFVFLTYSHPPLDSRVKAIREHHAATYGGQ